MPVPSNRADHVGSLLRPEALRRAHRDHARGDLDETALAGTIDAAIAQAVAAQEQVGLAVISDGEFRRGSWFLGLLEAIDGLELGKAALEFRTEEGEKTSWTGPTVIGKLARKRPIVVDDYIALQSKTDRIAKVTLPTPSIVHFFGGTHGNATGEYRDADLFLSELAAIYRQELAELHAAGCRYVQLDEVPLVLLCDERVRADVARYGQDPEHYVSLYISAINEALRNRPADMAVGLHLCRGNYRGRWMGSGGYEPIAERLLNEAKVDAFLLEFDSDRAGTFAPLRFLPPSKRAYLGLVSTKTGTLENIDDLRRRLDEAFAYAPAEQLGICPQCGFASSAGGNPITPEQQWAKLARVVDVARLTWGCA